MGEEEKYTKENTTGMWEAALAIANELHGIRENLDRLHSATCQASEELGDIAVHLQDSDGNGVCELLKTVARCLPG